MTSRIIIREYIPEDAQALAEIFYGTIHRVNIKDYTEEQVSVWAPRKSLEAAGWREKFARTKPLVALVDSQIAGYAVFEPDGQIDHFYCHHHWIGRGIGFALINAIYERAKMLGVKRLYVEASITAKPFFERQGFAVTLEQTVVKSGVKMTNYKMEKYL